MIDIPTALTLAETEKLQEICRDKYVMEIGALLGYSTVAIGQVAKGITSIDPHEGYPEHDPKPTFETWLANVKRYGVLNKITPVRNTWQNAFSLYDRKWKCPLPYDVVFMDLTGRYEDTKECLMHFHPEWGWRLKTICVHDCGHPDWPGVMEAVKEFRDFLGMHAIYEQIDKLGIFHYA
jgi:hypothetical protein